MNYMQGQGGDASANDRLAGEGGGDSSSPLSMVRMLSALLRRWKLLVAIPAAVVILAFAIAVGRDSSYLASSTFKPAESSGGAARSGLSALAAQFNVSLGGLGPEESLQFYVRLLESYNLRHGAALTEYEVTRPEAPYDTVRGTLVDLLEIEADSPERAAERAAGWLSSATTVRTDMPSGVLTLQVEAPWPALATALNRRLLELVNEFNLERRQSQAAAERQFVEERMEEARARLADAEAAYDRFLERNRDYHMSPVLSTEAARHQRNVGLRQQLYTSLAQAYEEVRIQEIRSTPVIAVIDPPGGRVPRVGRNVVRTGALGVVLGILLAIGVALLLEYVAWHRGRYPLEYAELEQAKRSALAELLPRRSAGEPVPALDPGMDAVPGVTEGGTQEEDHPG